MTNPTSEVTKIADIQELYGELSRRDENLVTRVTHLRQRSDRLECELSAATAQIKVLHEENAERGCTPNCERGEYLRGQVATVRTELELATAQIPLLQKELGDTWALLEVERKAREVVLKDYADCNQRRIAAEAKLAQVYPLLDEARDYLLVKAGRHDINWHDAHDIVNRIDAIRALPQGGVDD